MQRRKEIGAYQHLTETHETELAARDMHRHGEV